MSATEQRTEVIFTQHSLATHSKELISLLGGGEGVGLRSLTAFAGIVRILGGLRFGREAISSNFPQLLTMALL